MAYVHTPHKLLDAVIAQRGLKNDAALAASLQLAPPVISKTRTGRLQVGASLILRLHEVFGMPVAEIRELAAA